MAVPLFSGRMVCTEPLPKIWVPTTRARLWSCKAPATISEAEAEPPLTSTTRGTVRAQAGRFFR
jgi:hypothetical protein